VEPSFSYFLQSVEVKMSDEELDPREMLLKNHRKEKKDLQGKIQVLKKTSSKGDKKKKKEVLEEIASLEAEMNLRHKNELAQFEESCPEVEPEPVTNDLIQEENDLDDNSTNGQRISKAQKRREKKAAKEKERINEIERQEEENQHGARNIEAAKIKEILESRGLLLQEIPSNGDCLFAGLVQQLRLRQVDSSVKSLRKAATDELRGNSSDYLPFLSHPVTGEMLNEAQFEKYCNDMQQTPAWGGQVELRALSQALKLPIEVVQSDGPSMVVGEEFVKNLSNGDSVGDNLEKALKGENKLILTYHRHAYGLGEHYNAVKSKS